MYPRTIAGLLLGALALLVGLGVYTWIILEDVAISWHGLLAIAGAVVGITALGGGLMALVFYSARSGHDDDVGRPGRRDQR